MIIAASFLEQVRHVIGSILLGFANVAFTGSLLFSFALLGAVVLHVIAIATYRWALHEDLVAPMLRGWKAVPAALRAPEPVQASPWLAVMLLATSGAFVYWLVVVFPRG